MFNFIILCSIIIHEIIILRRKYFGFDSLRKRIKLIEYITLILTIWLNGLILLRWAYQLLKFFEKLVKI